METPGAFSYIQNVLADGGNGVSSLMIDPYDELIWMGSLGGHVTSYYSAACDKYTSFPGHAYPVLDLAIHSEGVISLSPASVRMNIRRGLTRWMQTSDDFYELCTMSLLDKTGHRLAVSGNQQSLFELDINRNGQIVRRASIEGATGYKILRNNPTVLACADFAGGIDLRNKDTFQVTHRFAPSSSNMIIQDMALLGNQLVTCESSDVYGNRPTAHMYLKVYDLRALRPQLIQMHFHPHLLKFLEVYTSRVICVSTSGQSQVFDVGRFESAAPMNSIDMPQYPITCFDVCSNSQGIVFGDEAGNIFVYGTGPDIHFHNNIQRPTEFADPVETPPAMDVCDPLNIYSSVPMPLCDGPLLSDLPSQVTRFRYHVSNPVDPTILSAIKMVGQIGYAPNNGRMRRNEYNYITNKHSNASFKQQDQSPSHESQIPLYYHKIDIKYNKLGIEDFDYNQYNNTCFAGLESSLPNCYSNDMLQVLYFLEPLRVMLTNHSCDREFCLSCELAYLFHMLESAQGMPCQASNFLRAFRTIPEVSALGLLSNEDRLSGCRQLIQQFTRFIFTQLHSETTDANGVSVVSQLFTMPQKTLHRCWCGKTSERDSSTNMVNLIYSNLKEELGQNVSFADVLRQSMGANEIPLNTWCESCSRYNTTIESRRTLALPDILVINCGLESNAALDIWSRKGAGPTSDGQGLAGPASGRVGQGDNTNIQFINKKCRFGDKCNRRSCRFLHSDTPDPYTAARGERDAVGSGQSWLPFKLNIAARADGGSPTVRETEINNGDGINYELTAIVCVILHDSRENIISLINVGAGYHERHHSSGMSHWYVFNDFTVHSVKESEVGHLPIEWKQPCMLYYTRKDIALKYKDLKVMSPITEDIIRKDTSIPRNASARLKTFTSLLDSEQFNAADIVAMDAEFVTLNQEEAEIRSDGTRATIRPSQRSVARISCLRGQGPMEGVAFIDDYIATQEQVVDYLTQFSGIQPGDLDVTVSSKHLSTLKATYQKLRLLVDKGVIFVGHGLKNDFRVINLVVPQEQVRDTVLLFQLRNKRMLSLRFLAWHFFGETIQSETHDSIEDAKTALRLYRKYLELEQRDEINAALTELYEVGKKYNWKVPKDNGAGSGHSNAGTPAAPLD